MAIIIDTNSYLLRQTTSSIQPEMPFDIPLLLGLFNEVTSGRDKNSSPFTKRSTLPTLLLNIIWRKPSNLLFRPSGNYDRLKKEKFRAALTFWSLGDLNYIMD